MNNTKKILSYAFSRLGYRISRLDSDSSEDPSKQILIKPTAQQVIKKSSKEKEFEFISLLPGFLDLNAYDLFCVLGKLSTKNAPRILEIGIFCGKSYLALGMAFKNPKQIVGVDPFFEDFKDSPVLEDEGEYLEVAASYLTRQQRLDLLNNTIVESKKLRPGLSKRFTIVEMTQDEYLADKPGRFDVVHIDGEHTFSAVYNFFNESGLVLNKGAIVIVDDFLNPGFPGISEAVHTHPLYLNKQLAPIFYGFNKAVFIYMPQRNQASALLSNLVKHYRSNNKAVRLLGDGSVTVQ